MKNETLIVCVLDRSGSMGEIIDEAIGGINNFIKTQQELPGEAKMTIAMFDDQYELLYNNVDVKEIKQFTKDTYNPRGLTALLDATGKTINNVGQNLKALPENERPSKILFCILTDGIENASKEFNAQQIKEMIAHQEEKYNWSFIYIASGLDTINDARNIGISGYTGYNNNKLFITCGIQSLNNVATYARSASSAEDLKVYSKTDQWVTKEE